MKSNLLSNVCGFNEKLFFGIKKKLIDFQNIEERKDILAAKTGQIRINAKVVTKPEKLTYVPRSGYINDKDVLRLQSVKDTVFPIYNYQKLIHDTNSN